MIESRRARLLALAVVVAALAVALVAFGTLGPNPADGRYPATTDVIGDEDRYLGERVQIGGEVVETDPLVVADSYQFVRDGTLDTRRIAWTITDAQPSADLGDAAQVYGTLTDERTIRSTTTRISTGDRRYMYLVSFLAGLWVLARLVRQWRLDPQRLAVTPRETPLTVRSVLPDRFTTTEDSRDA